MSPARFCRSLSRLGHSWTGTFLALVPSGQPPGIRPRAVPIRLQHGGGYAHRIGRGQRQQGACHCLDSRKLLFAHHLQAFANGQCAARRQLGRQPCRTQRNGDAGVKCRFMPREPQAEDGSRRRICHGAIEARPAAPSSGEAPVRNRRQGHHRFEIPAYHTELWPPGSFPRKKKAPPIGRGQGMRRRRPAARSRRSARPSSARGCIRTAHRHRCGRRT